MKVNRIADIDGKLLYGGDEIILTEWIMALDECVFKEGVVKEENGRFFLEDTELFLTDVFKITKHGQTQL